MDNGHTISNLTISRTDDEFYAAIFEHLEAGAMIKNVLFKDANISNIDSYAAVICGSLLGTSTDMTSFCNVGITGKVSR